MSPRNNQINIYYLKDKILTSQILHEKYEALSLFHRQQYNPNFEQVLILFMDKIISMLEGFPHKTFIMDLMQMIAYQPYKNLVN